MSNQPIAEQDTCAHGHGHSHDHDHAGGCGIVKHETINLIVKEDIQEKARELAGMIFSSEEVRHFQRAESQINGNTRVQALIAQMKKKQKEIVAFKSFQNEKMVSKIEGEIETLQEELDGIPIVSEFQQSQTDINYLLQLVISIVRDTVAEKINVEASSEKEDPEECME
ncbi:hypothetical protein EBB07_27880 [Paenibacillaceae bacterium]|nr:hypothetical protein EBB07_27880 [Paenibacillaceae bacterium]